MNRQGYAVTTQQFGPGNPLESNDPSVWEQLVEAAGPAAMLLVIERRMGGRLVGQFAPEDIWQETLLHAWRDRASCRWDGVRAFRRWLIGIIDHRIHDAADYVGALKRGGDAPPRRLGSFGGNESIGMPEPMRSTTPSRVALHREQATAMKAALTTLDPDLECVVRLRLVEGLAMADVATSLGIGLSAAKHRFRKGAVAYRRALLEQLGSAGT